MTEPKPQKKHFIQKYPIIPVLFIFLFAWGWLILITTFKPSQAKSLGFEFEYFNQVKQIHFYIKNDSLLLNQQDYYQILENKKEEDIRIIKARNTQDDSIKILIYGKKAMLVKD